MKKALLITISGEKKMVYPRLKGGFDYRELQAYVGGTIEIVPLGKGRELICHEEGKLIGLSKNNEASKIWNEHYPIDQYPENNDQLVVGDILIVGRNLEELL